MPGLEHRPCGACGELVSAEEGCVHWKPGTKGGKRVGWTRGRARSASGELSASTLLAVVSCDCGKPPGPPYPHEPNCARTKLKALLDKQVNGGVELVPSHPPVTT